MTGGRAPLRLGSRTDGGRSTYRFWTRDGLHSDASFREEVLLALDALWDRDLGDLLVVEANYGVLGTVLGERAATVTMTETSARAADCCRGNAALNGVDARVEVVPRVADIDGRFDAVVYAPEPYAPVAVAKQRLADALSLLRDGGDLWVAGSAGSGLSRYRDCLGSLGAAPCEAAADGRTRLLHAGVSETRPTVTYVEPSRFAATVDGVSLELVSDPGLFSAGRLDDGTGLLAESVDPADDARVLDLCCGYGPIGAAVGRATGATVTLSDDDARATQCARRTLAASGVDATVVTADGVEGVRGQTFDRVLCNPPTHAGGGVLGDLFDGAADVLAPDGRLTFVRHRRLDLAGHLDRFRRVERVVKGPEHVVREARL